MIYAVRIDKDGEPSDEMVSRVDEILNTADWESDYDGGINLGGTRIEPGEWIVSNYGKLSVFSDDDFNRLVRPLIEDGNIYD